MELTRRLLVLAIPHAFVITAPGATAVRLAVEKELRKRGWPEALSPADADLLVLCGQGGADFDSAAQRVWSQFPAPRARAEVCAPEAVGTSLDPSRAALTDLAALRRSDADRAVTQPPSANDNDLNTDGAGDDDGNMDMGGDDHGNMDMSGMDMDLPGGLPMADRAPDRDGLKLDQLHLVLGPALPHWPAGLIVRLLVQGDVAQSAEVSALSPGPGVPFWDGLEASVGAAETGRVRAAAAADSLQRFLWVAGWSAAARTGCWLRDELLDFDEVFPLNPRFSRWLRQVRRSPVLRWSTNGLGRLDGAAPPRLQGDVTARWLRWTDDVAAVLDSREPASVPEPSTNGRSGRNDLPPQHRSSQLADERAISAQASLTMLPSLLAGQELAVARLIVASLDPDLDALHAATHPGATGPAEALQAGPPQAGPPQAGPPQAGPPQAGPPQAGPPQAGPPQAGTPHVHDKAEHLND
ncbi:hypothetical protein IV498_04905 [Paenarthrobacter sp. Z7-10]|uniref:hypothetical protein n=1 Tax=Paenarthrobacter sp. Z7-10 TaxID=2787635 RepID=UPI0022A90684|nr:hypothetical protein [Paenarthrobacter sp. Z7-10]MCZ2402537.1 hypothetical protein [Paenarthrobacter sp. Z7-10]